MRLPALYRGLAENCVRANRLVVPRIARDGYYLASKNSNVSFSEKQVKEQHRFANMGQMVEIIKNSIPTMLQQNLPKEIVSDDIKLKILPDTHTTIPVICGRMSFNTAVKLMQFGVTHVLIPPESEVYILSARLCGHFQAEHRPPSYMIRWRTFSEQRSSRGAFPSSFSARSINFAPSQLAGGLGLMPHEFPVLTGIFEFEFNYDCTQIELLTITDLEYLSKPVEEIAGV